jgi:spermidine synthase
VWSKQLSLVLGNSLHAISTVVAAFLCGLALGAWALGRRLTGSPGAPGRYARLELGIAALGLLSLAMPGFLERTVGAIATAVGEGTAAFAATRFLLVFVSLLPPTLLMGATLPVLVDHFERDWVGPALARLYALNTVGAVAGSWLAGFVLVPGLGLRATTVAAALLNILAAGLALVFGNAGERASAARAAADDAARADRAAAGAPTSPDAAATRSIVAVGLALSGFAALAFQIAWVRLFGLVLGSSVYSFAGVLGVYLAGLALGAAVAGRWLARSGSLAGFAALQAAIALTAAAELWLFPGLPDRLFTIAQRAGGDWGGLFLAELGLVAAVILVPCALLGAVFPLAARLLSGGDGGRAAGRAYAVNTVGTIAGSLAAGFVLVPRLGVQGTHAAAIAVAAAAALLALGGAWRAGAARGLLAGGTVAALALAGMLASVAPAWNPVVMSAGVFRPQVRDWIQSVSKGQGGSPLKEALGRDRVLLYREGLNGSVLVTRDTVGHNTILRINGKADASDTDMLTQVLFGLVPGAMADSGARTLVIGQGSGVTLEATLAAGAGQTDLAELESAVIDGSRFFHAPGKDPLDDPRVRVRLEDGRTVLAYARKPYDLIVSEPSNPWLAGVNNLFTRDFYRLVRAHLAPGGVFAQWIQLYEISPQTFRAILAGFLDEFPRGNAFIAAGRTDLVLVACDSARSLPLARLRAPATAPVLERAKLLGPESVAAFWVGSFDSLRALAAGAERNTDDRPVVEYRAPRDLVERSRAAASGTGSLADLMPLGRWRDTGALFAGWDRATWFDARARQLVRKGFDAPARDAVLDARAEGEAELAARLERELTGEVAGRELAALVPRARDAALAGRTEEARSLLERASVLAPANGRVWVLLAEQQRQLGDAAGALASVDRALAVGNAEERRDASVTAGLVEVARGRMLRAAQRFAAARALDPSFAMAWLFEARARLDGGDRAGARATLRAGLAALPGDPQLAAMAGQLSP